jgi:non-ribosomal peptide synthetase component F
VSLLKLTTRWIISSFVYQRPGGCDLFGVHYDSAIYQARDIQSLLDQFEALLHSISENPDTPIRHLNILSENRRRQLLVDWNNTKVSYPDQACIHELFEEQVERTPGAVAVTYESESLSFRELNDRANQLAHYLRQLGGGPEQVVGLYLARSVEMITALVAVWKAGAAYLPLDPMLPKRGSRSCSPTRRSRSGHS